MSGIGLSIPASHNSLGFFSQPQEQFFIQQLKKITLNVLIQSECGSGSVSDASEQANKRALQGDFPQLLDKELLLWLRKNPQEIV